ncbi:hypothetical protein Tco_0418911 [Tanacetum coccineum]
MMNINQDYPTSSRTLIITVAVDGGDGGEAKFGEKCGALTNKCGGLGELMQVHLMDFNSSIFGKMATAQEKKLFKTQSQDNSSLPEFDLFSDPENQSEKEVAEVMGEPTMEEYMMKTREDYGSVIARPEIDDKAHFELKGQFLKQLRDNTFSGSNNEDANEHIKKVLEIVDLFHIP